MTPIKNNEINNCRRCGFIDKLYQENYRGEMTFICMIKADCDARKNNQFIKSHNKNEIKLQLLKTPNLLKDLIENGITDEEYFLIAVKTKSSVVKWIKNPSRKIQEIALKDNYKNYFLMKRSSIFADIESKVFLEHPTLIKFVKNPSIGIQLALIYLDTNLVFEFKKVAAYTAKIVTSLNPKITFIPINEKYNEEFGYYEPTSIFRKWFFHDCVCLDTDSEFSIEF